MICVTKTSNQCSLRNDYEASTSLLTTHNATVLGSQMPLPPLHSGPDLALSLSAFLVLIPLTITRSPKKDAWKFVMEDGRGALYRAEGALGGEWVGWGWRGGELCEDPKQARLDEQGFHLLPQEEW